MHSTNDKFVFFSAFFTDITKAKQSKKSSVPVFRKYFSLFNESEHELELSAPMHAWYMFASISPEDAETFLLIDKNVLSQSFEVQNGDITTYHEASNSVLRVLVLMALYKVWVGHVPLGAVIRNRIIEILAGFSKADSRLDAYKII